MSQRAFLLLRPIAKHGGGACDDGQRLRTVMAVSAQAEDTCCNIGEQNDMYEFHSLLSLRASSFCAFVAGAFASAFSAVWSAMTVSPQVRVLLLELPRMLFLFLLNLGLDAEPRAAGRRARRASSSAASPMAFRVMLALGVVGRLADITNQA